MVVWELGAGWRSWYGMELVWYGGTGMVWYGAWYGMVWSVVLLLDRNQSGVPVVAVRIWRKMK